MSIELKVSAFPDEICRKDKIVLRPRTQDRAVVANAADQITAVGWAAGEFPDSIDHGRFSHLDELTRRALPQAPGRSEVPRRRFGCSQRRRFRRQAPGAGNQLAESS